MASVSRADTLFHLSMEKRSPCLGILRLLFIAFFQVSQANKQAFIQSDTMLEVLHFGNGGLLETESDLDLSSYHQKSSPLQRGSCRPIRFEPPMLDFHEQPVGMPKMEKVYLHNPSSEETIILISISATTAHFHASFFQNRIIPPGGNTSFDVVFLARVVGNVENTLFINTSHHGVFTYQVFGVGIPNPYRLRPFIGARVPVNSSFSPLINIHNPHSEPLQVVEMYSSGGDLHLELPTGQQGGTKKLWEIPPFETKGVMRASFSSRDADNHTAFIRIKTNASSEDQFIILPVEVEVTTAPGIYSSTEMLDFGTLRSQDRPKQLNLHLLNSGTKDVPITSIRPTPSNEAVSIDFKPVTLRAGENRYTKVASISFDASKARRPFQFSGKITVKAKEKSYSKLEIPYQAEVLEGFLGFDHTATLFHIRDSPTDPVERLVFLTNTFSFAILIHNVSLPEEAKTMFAIHNFSTPVLVLPHESQTIFTLYFQPVRPSIHIDSNILLITNASKFHLPIRAYTGFLEPVVLPPSPEEHTLDFSVLSATDVNSLIFVVINSNPIELKIKSWFVTGDSLTMDLLRAESGNRTTALSRTQDLQNASASDQQTVILASGYYAAFRVTLAAKDLEGVYDGAVHITTDYEILTIQVKAVIAVGTLTSSPKHIFLPASFPGKTVHQSLNILSSYSQRVKLQEVRSLTEDVRFYSKRLRSNKDELEPRCRSKVANIYFDASLQCGDHCYIGLPFLLKSESKPHGLSMQEGAWDTDVELHQTLLRRWQELKDSSGHEVRAVFEVNTDLQKKVQTMVTAEMTWPSIIGSTRQIIFPLTNSNSSSEEQLVLENPADVPVYVQVLPLALYANPSAFAEKLADRFPLGKSMNISANTLEFQVYKNHTPVGKGGPSGLAEGPTWLLLSPGEVRSLLVRFTPTGSHSVMSLLIVRNNLTVLDYLVVQGQGTTESLKVAGRSPGPGSSLRFKMTESLLKDCTEEVKSKEPNFTLRRTFKVENVGQLPISIRSTEISGYACEGFGFKVLNCQEFALKPNASKDIVILFTPDFTASRVIRELKLVTAGGSEFVFVLNASLPYHMLAPCADALPRPSWELELYVIVSLIMSSMFLLVIATAYLEAQGIWEPFRRRLSLEAANGPMETGKPFDLRDIVRIQTDPNSSEYGDSNHNVTRGMYATGGSLLRGGGRPCGRASTDLEGLRSRTSSSRAAMQTGPQFGGKGSGGSGSSSDGLPTQCQLPVRRLRSSRLGQGQQPAPPQQVLSPPEPPVQTAAAPSQPPKPQSEGPARLSSVDSDYIGLLDAMDKDLDRPESPCVEVFPEQPPSPAAHSKATVQKGKIQRKSKAQKKREEKEQQGRGRPRTEDVKDALADDDSSSTTTETSNPDMEASIKEEPVEKKGRTFTVEKEEPPAFLKPRNKKLSSTKKEGPADSKSSSLELPYVTPLENKQRKNFTSKLHPTLTTGAKARPLPKQRAVPCGKAEDCRPSPLGKFLSQGLPGELGNSSSSEGEKDSPPPEWDTVPLHKAGSPADSLQQLSIQTMNADPFLKRPLSDASCTCSPPPTSLSLVTRGTYSSVVNANSETGLKKPAGNKSKLAPLATLPGKNGNPTFAAVAAGYDKSPGGSGPPKASTSKAEAPGKAPVPRLTSVESDGSDSSGLWSPTDSTNSPNFNPFGPNNTFNLSGVFRGMTFPKSQEPQQNWGDFNSVQPSIWDTPSTEPLHPWPISSGSPTAPTVSILGNPSSLWSPSTLFSSPIWSTSGDGSLHSLAPVTSAPLSDLICGPDGSCPTLAPPSTPAPEIGRAYNPWSVWGPTLNRRSSEPWPDPSDKDA
ncbi:transmembrane protein 131 isoform X1 [Brienomyrus brachyistius]|uniref:transmembrane protein 131 isoform X1 n=1 Tax=Brienomyrus brachyistius TaxID=42636 RepID=UPI0020B281C5|nr:transmembrane protein 131 isoform X1 [Brienomyrus brachyistius]